MNSRFGRQIAAACGALALVVFAGGAADAKTPAGGSGAETVLTGGVTQSVDPTAYNYVTPTISTGGVVQPMNAVGIGYISVFNYSWNGFTIPVPLGYLAHEIIGSGLHVSSEAALYGPSPGAGGIWGVNICNWRIDFQNRSSSNGNIVATRVGATHSGCSVANVTRTLSNFNVSQGSECARLYVNGTFRGEQCHAVY